MLRKTPLVIFSCFFGVPERIYVLFGKLHVGWSRVVRKIITFWECWGNGITTNCFAEPTWANRQLVHQDSLFWSWWRCWTVSKIRKTHAWKQKFRLRIQSRMWNLKEFTERNHQIESSFSVADREKHKPCEIFRKISTATNGAQILIDWWCIRGRAPPVWEWF